jgi:HK97 family phage prohead protease
MPNLNFDFQIKKATKSEVIIEGLANANTIDRIKERITPEAWQLDNYKKNPVVLFDHGHDPCFGHMPIGRALEVQATPEGLFTRIQLSSSKSEKISAIRDLVEEGILKTFSVGFEPKETQKASDDPSVSLITKAELLETSIVPIPMNQDSTFSMLRKRKAFWNTPLARKWYDRFYEQVKLVKKQAWVAAAINRQFSDLIEKGQIRNQDAAVRYIADEAKTTMGVIRGIMDGSNKEISDEAIKGFATVLHMDASLLMNLRNGNFEMYESLMAKHKGEPMTTEENKEPMMEDQDKAECQTDEGKDTEKAAGESKAMPEATSCIHAVLAPKSQFDTVEAAAEVVGSAGYSVEAAEELEDAWMFVQVPADQCDTENAQPIDIGAGIIALVTPKKGEEPMVEEAAEEAAEEATEQTAEMTAEADAEKAAEPMAEEKPEEEKPEEEKPMADEEQVKEDGPEFTDEQLAEAAAAFKAEHDAVVTDGEGNPPNWVADEAAWEKAKRMARAAGADDIYPFTVWAYLNVLGGGKKSAHPAESKSVGGIDENPYLELGRQQNVLLGTLINEVQGMSSKLDGLANLTLAKAQEEVADEKPIEQTASDTVDETEGKDDEASKSLDMIREYQRNLDMKLKRLNV